MTGQGLESLEDKIFRIISQGKIERSDEVIVNNVRQKDHLEKVLAALSDAITACDQNISEEFIAQHIRMALGQLGALVGETFTDDVLDILFNQFCIGK